MDIKKKKYDLPWVANELYVGGERLLLNYVKSIILERGRVEGIEAVTAVVAHELMHKNLFDRVVKDEDKDGVRYENKVGVTP